MLKNNPNNRGAGLIMVLSVLAVIIILAGMIYYGSTRSAKNSIEVKKNAENKIEAVNSQVNDYNEMIKKSLERTERQEPDGVE